MKIVLKNRYKWYLPLEFLKENNIPYYGDIYGFEYENECYRPIDGSLDFRTDKRLIEFLENVTYAFDCWFKIVDIPKGKEFRVYLYSDFEPEIIEYKDEIQWLKSE